MLFSVDLYNNYSISRNILISFVTKLMGILFGDRTVHERNVRMIGDSIHGIGFSYVNNSFQSNRNHIYATPEHNCWIPCIHCSEGVGG